MRSIPEWIGKTDDTAPPLRVKLRIFENTGGCCAACKRKLYPGDVCHYDHIKPLWDGGENRESNLQPLCTWCHLPKTTREAKERAQARRVKAKHLGLKKPKRKISYRRFNGEPVFK